jgi:cell division protease FtsH
MIEGPTGTGKTSLVRALVHEAGVSNIYVSASSFVELYVGQGALRIREVTIATNNFFLKLEKDVSFSLKLFKKAKCLAPCLIHIDELDALVSLFLFFKKNKNIF